MNIHAVGLSDYGPTTGYIERQLKRWTAQYRAAQTENIPEMEALIDLLNKQMPRGADSQLISLVHADYRLDNLIFHPTEPRVIAVLVMARLALQCRRMIIPHNRTGSCQRWATLLRTLRRTACRTSTPQTSQ